MINTIIFDWGGVLGIDSNEYTSAILSEKFDVNKKDLQRDLNKVENIYSEGQNCEPFFTTIINMHNLSISESELENIYNSSPDNEEIVVIAKDLKNKGYNVCLFSNQMKIRSDFIRNNKDLSSFDYIFFSNEIELMKPKVEAFQYILSKIGSKAEECIFIDDNEQNIKAAENLGIKGIFFINSEQLKEKLKIILK